MGRRGIWARDLAVAMGNNNPSDRIINWISAWTALEGTHARYNPLATTQQWEGATNFNTVGVKNYPTRAIGIAATKKTLSYDYAGYADITAGIQTNDVERAIRGLLAAPWGTNGARVQQAYRTRDLRNEYLLSEPEDEGNSGDLNSPLDTGPQPDTGGQGGGGGGSWGNEVGGRPREREWGAGGGGGGDWSETITVEGEEISFGMRVLYAMGGLVLIGISIAIAFKKFVPAGEIAKTAATVAEIAV